MAKLKTYEDLCYKKMAEAKIQEGLYCNVTWDNLMCWDQTPAGTTAFQRCADYVNRFNSAKFAKRECLLDGTWKHNPDFNTTNGWTDYSECLTENPADNINDHIERIRLMTDIGYGLSLASLIVAELIMIFSKRLHCKSNTLHINLFFAFILRAAVSFIQNISFVEGLGFEKDIIRQPGGKIIFNPDSTKLWYIQTDNSWRQRHRMFLRMVGEYGARNRSRHPKHWECKLLMTMFMYALTASMMWIFVEGLYLHMLVYRTLFTERHGMRLYVFLGWGLPLVSVIPWVLVRIFKDDELCWNIYIQKHYVWIIKGPIILAVLVNSVFFVSIVLVLCRRVKFHRYPKGSSQHFRKIVKFAIVLIPLFGVIYLVFAPFPTGINENADIIVLYCEMFYNSLQGFILALLFCFLNEEVQNQIRRWCYRRRLGGFSTRTLFMSSLRKSTNNMRIPMTRDPNNCGGVVCVNGKTDEMAQLKWKSSRTSNGSKQGHKDELLKDTGYDRVVCQEVDASTCTIDTV